MLDAALANASIQLITEIAFFESGGDEGGRTDEITVTSEPGPEDIVIDIRHESEQGARPPALREAAGEQLLHIPFLPPARRLRKNSTGARATCCIANAA